MDRSRGKAAPSHELFDVMNDRWRITEQLSGLYVLLERFPKAGEEAMKIGPTSGDNLAWTSAVISELERHLRETK